MIIPIKTKLQALEYMELVCRKNPGVKCGPTAFDPDPPMTPIEQLIYDFMVESVDNVSTRSEYINAVMKKITEHNRKEKLLS